MNAKRTRTRFSDILRNSDWFAFLLRGFIKQQRVPVYPLEGVFFAEIRGRTTGFYDSDEQPQKGTEFTNLPISIRSLLCFSCAFSWPYHIKTRAVARTEIGGRFRFKSIHFCFSAPCFNLPKAVTTSDLNFSRAGFRLFPGFFCRSASMRLRADLSLPL